MITAFIDSSVLFAACLSRTGASHEIVRASIRGTVELVLSDYVLREVERTLTAKRPDALPVLEEMVQAVNFTLSTPSRQDVVAAARYTDVEDAPIVAAAKTAGVDYLVSLDRKHLVGVPAVSQGSGLTIVLPAEALAAIRQQRT
jgi:predicted nucleic acid-binding protein